MKSDNERLRHENKGLVKVKSDLRVEFSNYRSASKCEIYFESVIEGRVPHG